MSTRNYANDNQKLEATTIEVWSRRLDRCVSVEESREMLVNGAGFVRVIADWLRKPPFADLVVANDNSNMVGCSPGPKSDQGSMK
jgi:hypothetical protein